jgi:hypothetical protein
MRNAQKGKVTGGLALAGAAVGSSAAAAIAHAAYHAQRPLAKGLDDAMIALYQNGESLMRGNEYRCGCCCPVTKAT